MPWTRSFLYCLRTAGHPPIRIAMPDSDRPDILIVDDEELICFVLTHLLRVHGFSARTAGRGDVALRLIEERRPDLVLMDIRMPGMSGYEVLAKIREQDPFTPVILMTALSSVRDAVDAMRASAFDYIAKPFDNEQLIHTLSHALEAASRSRAEAEAATAREEALPPQFSAMGGSPAIRELARETMRLTRDGGPVLVIGEIGSGKRRVAHILHQLGGSGGPFLELDCTGGDEPLLRRALFGDGDAGNDIGMLRSAAGGTLLLDDVSDLPPALQDTLAGILRPRPGDAIAASFGRVLCTATVAQDGDAGDARLTPEFSACMEAAVLRVPPLRERREDIPMLVSDFLAEANRHLGTTVSGIDPDAMTRLVAAPWPGNVTQLRAVLRRATLGAHDRIRGDDLDMLRQDGAEEVIPRSTTSTAPLKEQVRHHVAAVERQVIFETLKKTGWNKSKASRLLGVTYKTLLKKVQEFGLERGAEYRI